MNLSKFNLGGLAAAAVAGIIATTTTVLSAGHSDPKSLAAAVAIGAGGGLLAGLIPPHKADGTLSDTYVLAGKSLDYVPAKVASIAEQVLATAEGLPTGSASASPSTTAPPPTFAAAAAPGVKVMLPPVGDPGALDALKSYADANGLSVYLKSGG